MKIDEASWELIWLSGHLLTILYQVDSFFKRSGTDKPLVNIEILFYKICIVVAIALFPLFGCLSQESICNKWRRYASKDTNIHTVIDRFFSNVIVLEPNEAFLKRMRILRSELLRSGSPSSMSFEESLSYFTLEP